MPLLDQPDLSIYGKQDLYKGPTLPAAAQSSQGRGSAGPTKGQLDFVSEEQQRQDISQLAQQYGDDYDGLVNAVSQKYPDTGYKLAQELEKRRQEVAKSDVERSKSKAAQLDDAATFIKGAMENPAIYPDVRTAAVQKFGALADRFLPQPNDPDLQNKLAGVLKTTLDTNTYLKGRTEAAQQFVDGKKMEGALGLLAISNTPETRKASEQALTAIGMGSLSQSIPDAATAQNRLAAYQAQQPQKAGESAKLGSFEDYVTRTYGTNPTPAQILAARKAYGQADDRALKVSVGGAAGTGGLTTGEGGGLEYEGTIARIMGRTPVGFTRSGVAVPIANEAARQNKMLGRTPLDSILSTAIYQGDSKALANIQKMEAGAAAYEDKAQKQLDIVDSLSDKVTRTKYPILNRAILAGQTEILGDPDATLLLNAIQTASTEYAKIVMGGTGSAQALSDTAAKESKKLLNSAMSAGTLKKATALMRTEMGLTMNGFGASRKYILDNMKQAGGVPQAATQAPDAASLRQKYKY